MKNTVLTLAAAMTLLMPSVSFASLGTISVPEPSITLLMVAGGIGAATAARLRRRR